MYILYVNRYIHLIVDGHCQRCFYIYRIIYNVYYIQLLLEPVVMQPCHWPNNTFSYMAHYMGSHLCMQIYY